MTITQGQELSIVGYHYVEKWRISIMSHLLKDHHGMIKPMLFAKGV